MAFGEDAAGSVAALGDAGVDRLGEESSLSLRLTHTSSSSNGMVLQWLALPPSAGVLVEVVVAVLDSSSEAHAPATELILEVTGRISTSDESKKRLSRCGLGKGDSGVKILFRDIRLVGEVNWLQGKWMVWEFWAAVMGRRLRDSGRS